MLLAGRVIVGDVEGGEVVEIAFDIRPFDNAETHFGENRRELVNGPRNRMDAAGCLRANRFGNVDFLGHQTLVEGGRVEDLATAIEGRRDLVFQLVHGLTETAPRVRVEPAERFH